MIAKEINESLANHGAGNTVSCLAETSMPMPKKTILSWLLYPLYMLVFVLILLCFEIIQRISLLLGRRCSDAAQLALNWSLFSSLRLLGTRFAFEGNRSFAPDKIYIIVCNHQSMFDIPILAYYFAKLHVRYIAKKELGRRIPAISVRLRNDGSALIDRSNPRQALPEIKRLGQRMQSQKFSVVLFPEGTRARQGVLKEFRPAGLSVLLKETPEAEIIPAAIDGSWQIAAFKHGPIPLGLRIRVRAGESIARSGRSNDEIFALAHQSVKAILNDMRKPGF
jgi:1-acyl-sn-glycerol-3-phosphate acyltransferase